MPKQIFLSVAAMQPSNFLSSCAPNSPHDQWGDAFRANIHRSGLHPKSMLGLKAGGESGNLRDEDSAAVPDSPPALPLVWCTFLIFPFPLSTKQGVDWITPPSPPPSPHLAAQGQIVFVSTNFQSTKYLTTKITHNRSQPDVAQYYSPY